MRISNIKNFFGGADNVTVKEIIEGKITTLTFNETGTPFDARFFDVDFELLEGDIAYGRAAGSNPTLSNLAKATNTDGTAIAPISVEQDDVISETTLGSFKFTTPVNLLSQFQLDGAPVQSKFDSNRPWIVAQKLEFYNTATTADAPKTSNTIIRLLWVIRYAPNV